MNPETELAARAKEASAVNRNEAMADFDLCFGQLGGVAKEVPSTTGTPLRR